MRFHEEPFRDVRVEQLRRLEMCERGLAEAFRRVARRRVGDEARMLHGIASEGERMAELLRERVEALGGHPEATTDESWLVGDSLADAEHLALATYHDHVGDFDEDTMELLQQHMIPHHRAALAYLERDSPVMRESEV